MLLSRKKTKRAKTMESTHSGKKQDNPMIDVQVNRMANGGFCIRGHSYASIKDYYTVIADCTRTIELNPEDVNAYYQRGLTYAALREHEKAADDYRAAARLGHKPAQDKLRGEGLD